MAPLQGSESWPPLLDTCVIWPCTLYYANPGVPHPAPTSPRPGRSSSPRAFSRCQFSFLSQRQGMPLRKSGEGAKPSTPPSQLQTKPLPSSCQQSRPGGNAKGPGQEEAGGGGDAPSPQSPSPSRVPRFWAQSSRGSKEKWGCHRLRRSSGAKGRGLGRVLDLAAGRRGPVPRCEAQ